MKRISIVILITTLLILISGCGNKTVDTQPNIILPGNSSLTVQVEWPTNAMTSLRNAPPAYLGLATIEVFLMEKEFAGSVFGTCFIDYMEDMESHSFTAPKRSDLMDQDFVSSIRGTEYEDKMYYYSFDVISSESQHKDGATIDNIVVGDYIMFLYGLQSSEFVSTYAIKSVSIAENQAASVTVYAADWITNSPVSSNSISLISGYYSTPTVPSTTLSLDVLNSSVVTVNEGTASFDVTYIFTYNGDIADLNHLVTSNFISGTSTPENVMLNFGPVTISTISSGTYQASFSATNIDILTVPTDITAKSGFNVGFQISEIIADEPTGISDWISFTLYIQDTETGASSLNLVSFAVTSVTDFDYLYYHAGSGDTQDPRTNNATSVSDIQGATIDLALDNTDTNQKIVIIYEDLTSTLSLHAGANPVAGTDFKIYKADDISQTDLSADFFTSALAYTGSGEKGIELYFNPINLEDTAGTYGFGSYILEVNAIDGGNSYTEKYHIFLEKGLYTSDQMTITNYNNGAETFVGSNIWRMTSVDTTGHFEKGNISLVAYPTTVNGYTKFYASCEVSISPENYILTIPVESSDQISSGLKVLTTTDIAYYGLGADTNNSESLYLLSLINNGFEFTDSGTASGALAKMSLSLATSTSNQYELKLNFTGLTQNDISDLPLEGGEHVCWYTVHLVNKYDIGSGVYAKGRKYIFFGKIYFKIQV